MKAIELETSIGMDGTIQLPAGHEGLYGQRARMVILLREREDDDAPRGFDPMKYSGTVDWPIDGLEYQHAVREEWA